LIVLEHARQAIRRQEEEVARLDQAGINVWHDVAVCADAAGDHVAVRMGAGLLGRQIPGVHLLLHVGVILRELAQPAVAQQIRTAVADLPDQKPRFVQRQRGHGRPHAPFVVLGQCALEDLTVRRSNRRTHPLRDLLIRQAADRVDLLGDDAHRHVTRDFSRRVAPHAIGHDKNPAVGNHAETVLIPRPDDADVGATRGSDVHEARDP